MCTQLTRKESLTKNNADSGKLADLMYHIGDYIKDLITWRLRNIFFTSEDNNNVNKSA